MRLSFADTECGLRLLLNVVLQEATTEFSELARKIQPAFKAHLGGSTQLQLFGNETANK